MMTDENILKRFDEFDDKLEKILLILDDIPQMKKDIQSAKNDSETVKDLVEAWNAVKTGGRFMRWVAPLIGGAFAAWATVKIFLFRIIE